MSEWVPKIQLYETDATTLRYTFPVVQSINAPQSNKRNTIISGLRGKGCIVIEGSDSEWDLIIRFILLAENYTELTTKIDAVETALPSLTPFILKIEKSIGITYEYKVMRIDSILYSDSLRTTFQECEVNLKVNSW